VYSCNAGLGSWVHDLGMYCDDSRFSELVFGLAMISSSNT